MWDKESIKTAPQKTYECCCQTPTGFTKTDLQTVTEVLAQEKSVEIATIRLYCT
jgi:hypothetical protein